MAEIKVDRISKKFGKVQALSNVSLNINDGESVVLLGPSGCGKTTLLRGIAGLETMDEGSIYIDGNLVDDLSPKERDLSMVFQNYALFPLMKAFDNIAFPLKIRGGSSSEIAMRVKEIAKILQIEGSLDKFPRQLSGGEQQRVAIGRAIARQPKAFLMDEPLSNLDTPTRVQLRTELKRIHKDIGITTIYVTHDQSEAMILADHLGLMNHGKLIQFGVPEDVYLNPTSVFAASFIGNPSANLSTVQFKRDGENNYLEGPGLRLPLSEQTVRKLEQSNGSISDELILAIRTEDIKISKSRGSDASVEAEVQVIEPLGTTAFADVKLMGGESLYRITIPRDVKLVEGDRIWLTFNDEKIHIYDKKSGSLLA